MTLKEKTHQIDQTVEVEARLAVKVEAPCSGPLNVVRRAESSGPPTARTVLPACSMHYGARQTVHRPLKLPALPWEGTDPEDPLPAESRPLSVLISLLLQ